ncbi:MAG: 50S ribosomal protein L21 [Bacteroidota bacterium]|nr:50S ribosomal protein L21 [Bacteroidota bacterium]|tara:strand:+ start:180 stop:686 length:507 start_codon:yes stop_codon:yes gene_type:complete
MYAIVEIAGKQFKVQKDQKLYVHRLKEDEGKKVTFDRVLMVDNKDKVSFGSPVISGAQVGAKVLKHLKSDKVIVFKKKRRKGYRVKNGHRQLLTQIQISDISLSGAKTTKKSETKSKTAKKPETKEKSAEKKEDLTKLSVAALKDMAKSKGVSGISKMKKADLIKALS